MSANEWQVFIYDWPVTLPGCPGQAVGDAAPFFAGGRSFDDNQLRASFVALVQFSINGAGKSCGIGKGSFLGNSYSFILAMQFAGLAGLT